MLTEANSAEELATKPDEILVGRGIVKRGENFIW